MYNRVQNIYQLKRNDFFLKSKQTNLFFFFGEVRRINSKRFFETYFADLYRQLYMERMLKILKENFQLYNLYESTKCIFLIFILQDKENL